MFALVCNCFTRWQSACSTLLFCNFELLVCIVLNTECIFHNIELSFLNTECVCHSTETSVLCIGLYFHSIECVFHNIDNIFRWMVMRGLQHFTACFITVSFLFKCSWYRRFVYNNVVHFMLCNTHLSTPKGWKAELASAWGCPVVFCCAAWLCMLFRSQSTSCLATSFLWLIDLGPDFQKILGQT